MLDGLLFAHSCGTFHRDIKPSNILVSRLGLVKLVDFGLARPMFGPVQPEEQNPVGLAGTGTPTFMSPEQARGEHLNHLTDIFSVGIVGYILLTGRHPFNHPSAVVTVFELIKEADFNCERITPATLKGVPEGVCNSLMRMLHKDKAARCQSLWEPLSEITREPAQSCPRCGSPNPMSNSYCGQCGSHLKPFPQEADAAGSDVSSPPRPRTAAELTDEGFALGQSDDWQMAISKYEMAIEADPNYGRAYANLGFAYNRFGKYQQAIEVLTEGIERTSDGALLHRLYDNRGFAKSNLKDYEGAISDFNDSLKYNRNNPRIYYHRAESEALMGRLAEANADVVEALRLDPTLQRAIRLKQRLDEIGRPI